MKIIDEETQFQSKVSFQELPEQAIVTLPSSTATPNVLNVTRCILSNSAPLNITDFLGGQRGQEIKLLGDGFTTLVHGTKIFTNTGANKLLAANKVYTLTLFPSGWVENA